MTTIPVVMGDPEAECIAVLETVFGEVAQTGFPDEPLGADELHLQVELETSNAADYPVTERAQVRVTVHVAPGRRSDAKSIADTARSTLAVWPGNDQVASIATPGGRSGVTEDPETGNLMCWFLARVNLTGRRPVTP